MKYILPIILLFIGCFENKKPPQTSNNQTKTPNIKTINKKPKNPDIEIIMLEDFNLSFKKNSLIYPKKTIFLLFDDNSTKCKMQENVLKRLNIKYKKTNNPYLKNYFSITTYPTIVVLDKNKTVKYENFVPYEILKEERF